MLLFSFKEENMEVIKKILVRLAKAYELKVRIKNEMAKRQLSEKREQRQKDLYESPSCPVG